MKILIRQPPVPWIEAGTRCIQSGREPWQDRRIHRYPMEDQKTSNEEMPRREKLMQRRRGGLKEELWWYNSNSLRLKSHNLKWSMKLFLTWLLLLDGRNSLFPREVQSGAIVCIGVKFLILQYGSESSLWDIIRFTYHGYRTIEANNWFFLIFDSHSPKKGRTFSSPRVSRIHHCLWSYSCNGWQPISLSFWSRIESIFIALPTWTTPLHPPHSHQPLYSIPVDRGQPDISSNGATLMNAEIGKPWWAQQEERRRIRSQTRDRLDIERDGKMHRGRLKMMIGTCSFSEVHLYK